MHGATAAWGPREHLLADLIDQVVVNTWITAGAPRNNKPKPYPRPGAAAPPAGEAKTQISQSRARQLIAARGPRRLPRR